ncbi:MAG: acetyl-CoA carboxylase biotin carboxyl carrier protein [Candidatus Cyclobacteriaceae bacterium M3_2C_046]
MKIKEIRELLDYIAQSGMDEVNIETEEIKLSVKKNSSHSKQSEEQPQSLVTQPRPVETSYATEALSPEETQPKETKEDKFVTIKSPMIGTFYMAANPESEPFVKIGDMVRSGQTVCIIEAMKLFNEIESEVSGKIVKVLVENSSPVEYDQPLFLVDPS